MDMNPEKLVEAYLRIQSALVGFVSPSLVSVSFEGDNCAIRVRLVYWSNIPEDERVTILELERRLPTFFEVPVITESVFIEKHESPCTLTWPVFRVRTKVKDDNPHDNSAVS